MVVGGFDGAVAARTLYEIAAANGSRPRERRTSVIIGMFGSGWLNKAQLQAAGEIEAVFAAITSACGGRTACYAPERGQSAVELPATLKTAYTERYRPWRDRMGAVGVAASATVADIVLQVVIDNHGCQQIADRYRMSLRRARAVVRDGLAEYVRIAGW